MTREPKPGERLASEDFDNVVRLTPLVAIDLIVRSADGRVLVGRRSFERDGPENLIVQDQGSGEDRLESRLRIFKLQEQWDVFLHHSGNVGFFVRAGQFADAWIGLVVSQDGAHLEFPGVASD